MRDEKTRGKEKVEEGGKGERDFGARLWSAASKWYSKWDLGLVNTDESVWKLWEKDCRL